MEAHEQHDCTGYTYEQIEVARAQGFWQAQIDYVAGSKHLDADRAFAVYEATVQARLREMRPSRAPGRGPEWKGLDNGAQLPSADWGSDDRRPAASTAEPASAGDIPRCCGYRYRDIETTRAAGYREGATAYVTGFVEAQLAFAHDDGVASKPSLREQIEAAAKRNRERAGTSDFAGLDNGGQLPAWDDDEEGEEEPADDEPDDDSDSDAHPREPPDMDAQTAPEPSAAPATVIAEQVDAGDGSEVDEGPGDPELEAKLEGLLDDLVKLNEGIAKDIADADANRAFMLGRIAEIDGPEAAAEAAAATSPDNSTKDGAEMAQQQPELTNCVVASEAECVETIADTHWQAEQDAANRGEDVNWDDWADGDGC